MRQVEELFKCLDNDGGGYLSIIELRDGLNALKVGQWPADGVAPYGRAPTPLRCLRRLNAHSTDVCPHAGTRGQAQEKVSGKVEAR